MNDNIFDEIYEIMKASFPEYERRTYDGQKELLADPYYRLITEKNTDGHVIAFLAAWELPLLRFVEHIAVAPGGRGSGIGAKLMSEYIEESLTPVILEVELPDTDLAQRRIRFYERLGLHLNPFEYVQPSLQTGQPCIPLKMMSYPKPLTEEEFILYRDHLYSMVYKVAAAKD